MAEETKEKISEKKITEKLRENPWIVSTVVLAVIIVVMMLYSFSSGVTGNVVSEKDIGTKAVDFVNTQLLQGSGNVTLSSVSQTNGLYEVNVNYQGKDVPLYFTLDGENWVEQLVPLNFDAGANTQTQAPVEVPKTDKPVVELYVMSFCPYGNQAEDTLLPVYNLLKTKVDWQPHYIVSVNGDTVQSLHGQKEVDQDEREACVLKNSGIEKWFNFITYVNTNCGSDGSCWETAASKGGLNANTIKTCVTNNGLDLMKTNEAAADAAGASGSPTMFINGVETTTVYQYGNSQAYLDAICSAFTTAPSECSQVLASTQTAASGSC